MMKRLASASALLVFLVGPAAAQFHGRITGSVVDPSGREVPDAAVTLLLAGGAAPVLRAVTTVHGLFSLTGVRPDSYDLVVEADGFSRTTWRGVKAEPARETSLPPIQLKLATVSEAVEVSAAAPGVQTSNAENSITVSGEQVRRLPIIDRSATALIRTQAGVSAAQGIAVINGQRPSYANVTWEGINIQDSYNRLNAVDRDPLLLDQVGEFTLSTSNTNAAAGGGSAQVTYTMPPGTNEYHGSLYWYNRNSAAAANAWFNNRDRVPRSFLNQNQAGGTAAGPILKDKLLFYANYEARRVPQQATVNRLILTADARRGVFTYEDLAGNVRKVNVLEAAGVGRDPAVEALLAQVAGPERINNFRAGDSRESLLRNTAGYSFLRRNNRAQDDVAGKLDYVHSTRNVFSGAFAWNRSLADLAFVDGYTPVPNHVNRTRATLLAAAWRWNPTPRFTNEKRGGFRVRSFVGKNLEQFGPWILTSPLFSHPQDLFRTIGTYSDTYNYLDNSSYVRGKHSLLFGFQMQQGRGGSFFEGGITPSYSLGIGGNPGLGDAQLPSIRPADIGPANNLLATLAGYVSSYSQTFNAASRTSGFVSGAPTRQNFLLNNYALYAHDRWRLRPRLSLTLGLRYELYSPVDERDALFLLPRIDNNNPIATLLSNATLDFAGSAAGRPWYKKDKNNLAPNIGLAWDVFGNGRMAVRAGYSISYVNDEAVRSGQGFLPNNAGLSASSSRTGLSGRVSAGLPPVAVPVYQVPRTFADNYGTDRFAIFWLPDPGLATPYVQQWTFSLQREYKGAILEARYVGNHAVKALRAFDYNQVIIRENGFLDDFERARSNGNLARAATGVFNPNYNPSIPGSQALAVFPRLAGGGNLNNPTLLNLIQTGQPGALASEYQFRGLNGAVQFFPNPSAWIAALLTNFSHSSYNALQVEATRRLRAGAQLQTNYTFSKVLANADDNLTRFHAFLDINNARNERARSAFDLTHVIKANAIADLPFGQGRRVDWPPLRRLLSGWAASGLLIWQSGAPFSVVSGRSTLNQTLSVMALNTANTRLNKTELDSLLRFRQTDRGPFFVAAAAIGADGRAVAPDGSPPFNGQVFFHPPPGSIGALQQRLFSGPWTFNVDFALMKNTKIREKHSLELRAEASNVLNHPSWAVGNLTLDSTAFGRINSTFYGPRLIQFGLYYRF